MRILLNFPCTESRTQLLSTGHLFESADQTTFVHSKEFPEPIIKTPGHHSVQLSKPISPECIAKLLLQPNQPANGCNWHWANYYLVEEERTSNGSTATGQGASGPLENPSIASLQRAMLSISSWGSPAARLNLPPPSPLKRITREAALPPSAVKNLSINHRIINK